MESQTIDEKGKILPQGYLRIPRGEKAKFRISCFLYIAANIAVFILTLEGFPLQDYYLKTGIIIGGLFPIMTLLYFYRHYLGNPKSNNRTLGRWLLPSIFIQIITIFGFMITLQSPAYHGYQSQMFTGFYEYGKIFKSYNTVEKELLENPQDYMEKSEKLDTKIEQIMKFYLPFFDQDRLRKSNTLVSEGHEEKTLPEFKKLTSSINAIPFQVAFAFGFLGALIFSLRDGIKRFNNVDMYPKVYVFYAVRFIVSCSLSAALAYFVFAKWVIALGPIVFFMIGYFPERVITYLDSKTNRYLGIRKAAHTPIPLSLVQGLSAEKALKLREIGIEDIQNLAVASIDKMRDNLPFNRAMLCDWIAQSILILYFVDDIEKLRESGVRTILDLQECALTSEDDECQACAEIIGIKPVQLQYVRKILQLEYMKTRLEELRNCLSSEYKRRLQHGKPRSV